MPVSINLNIILGYGLIIPCLVHSVRRHGYWRTIIFFLGSVIVTGTIENCGIIFGGYHYPGSSLTVWYYKCPLDVCLGWYYIAYSCVFLAEKTVKFKNTFIIAALGALLAVNLDLFLDPVAVANGWWKWTVTNIYILNVPVNNWLGWWLLVFWFAVFYEHAAGMEQKWGRIRATGYFFLMTVACTACTGLCLLACNEIIIPYANVIAYTPDMEITGARLAELFAVLGLDIVMMGIIILSVHLDKNKSDIARRIKYMIPPSALLIYWLINIFLNPDSFSGYSASRSREPFSVLLQLLMILFVSLVFWIITRKYLMAAGKDRPSPVLDILPVAVLVVFWAAMMVVAALTSSFFVLLGLTLPLPFLYVNFRAAARIIREGKSIAG